MIKFERVLSGLLTYCTEIKGNYYAIDDIVVYDNEGVICKQCFRSAIGHKDNENCVEFDLPVLTRKMKVKFDKVEVYILRKKEDTFGNTLYDVYIHKDLISLTEPFYIINCGYVHEIRYGFVDQSLRFDDWVYHICGDVNSKRRELSELSKKLEKNFDFEDIEKIMAEMNRTFEELKEAKMKADAFTLDDYFQMIAK